jgi:hypothetical protein
VSHPPASVAVEDEAVAALVDAFVTTLVPAEVPVVLAVVLRVVVMPVLVVVVRVREDMNAVDTGEGMVDVVDVTVVGVPDAVVEFPGEVPILGSEDDITLDAWESTGGTTTMAATTTKMAMGRATR